MLNQSTTKTSSTNQPFRAMALLFLTVCLLISCPIKRELKATFLPAMALGHPSATAQFPKQIMGNSIRADVELVCTKSVQAILDEAHLSSLFGKIDFKNPLLFLFVSLAGLYLLLAVACGRSSHYNAFAGAALVAKIPLFLRYRQLVI